MHIDELSEVQKILPDDYEEHEEVDNEFDEQVRQGLPLRQTALLEMAPPTIQPPGPPLRLDPSSITSRMMREAIMVPPPPHFFSHPFFYSVYFYYSSS